MEMADGKGVMHRKTRLPALVDRWRGYEVSSWIGGLLMLLALAQINVARAEVREHLALYTVEGRDMSELRRELDRRGPRDSDGTVFHGHTQWEFGWQTELEASEDGCRLSGYRLDVDITITLPTWPGREAAPSKVAGQWDQYLATLSSHEDGHRDLVLEGYHSAGKLLAGSPSAPDCHSLTKRIEREMQRELARIDRASERFDQTTNHGRRRTPGR